MSRVPIFIAGAAAGAAAIYFLAPDRAKSEALKAAGKAKGAVKTATPGTGLSDPDDVTLARRVETEIFRSADAPKGDVSVDVQNGVATLRGEVDQDWSDRLAGEARKVDGIKGVDNQLHPPGTPAPSAPGS